MSSSYEYSYALEARRRQQLYNERVNATTEKFYRIYMEQYDRMVKNGFEDYIPNEMSRLQSDLFAIRNMLVSNPTEARDRSYEVGSYISSMFSIANAAIQQYERNERLEREQLKEEMKENRSVLLNVYYEVIQNIRNPITRNFARPELEKLKKSIISEIKVSPSDIQSIKGEIEKKNFFYCCRGGSKDETMES